LHKKINFPMQLEIGEYMSNLNKARPPPYELVGILVHQGQTCASGHYLAYVKKDGEWFRCNDSIITKVDEETVLNQQAYIMMYEVAEMREKTCSPSSPTNMKQTQMPHVDTTPAEILKDDFSSFSTKSEVRQGSTQHSQHSQRTLLQFLTDAEGGLSTLLSDLCCDSCCNTAINEPKERRMKPQRRGRRKQPRVLREDYQSYDLVEDDDSTVGTSDSGKMRKRNSSGSLSNLVDIERSRTSPRQRTHSFSNSEPGLDMESSRGNQSTRSHNPFRKHRAHRSHSSKPSRERGRSVHASGDSRELPPLPTSGHHRRAKSISDRRKKGYFI
jgi:hypothetical protein